MADPDLTARRLVFEERGLDVADVDLDPLVQFERWFDEVTDAGLHQPDAMALATVDSESSPTVRHVLLKGVDERGFAFFTNYESAKARDLASNPNAAVVFPWHQLSRQVRVAGMVEKLSAAESDEYFSTRPRGSQVSAWASPQSHAVESRAVLEQRAAELEEQFAGEPVPRPPFWGGYVLVPYEVELWQGRPNRLHDRVRYRRTPTDWLLERLAP